ncbi:DUF805 domain-containing protein [Deinococcus altitudinis]|uniref:DUF805 domain-containing protein n=1 Tax=Deinococcus altitudinis TaxID=468914 RepID=UPI0038916965
MKEFTDVLKYHYFDFSGRSRRREYWMFTLISILFPAAVVLLLRLMGGLNGSDARSVSLSPIGMILVVLLGLYGLAMVPPTLAIGARRLHDIGLSGWLMLLSLVGWLMLHSIVGLNIVLLVLAVLDSKPETNKWGPSPKGAGGYSAT